MNNQFLNVTNEEYHADEIGVGVPTLNYSTAKVINAKSALHAWLEHPKGGAKGKPHNKIMSFGEALHAIVLGKGAKALIIEANDFKTKKAREDRDEAYSKGLIPLLAKDHERVMKASESILRELAMEGIQLKGEAEQAMFWMDEGVACRGKMDQWEPPQIVELKITDWPLTPHSLRRLVVQMSYDIQAVTYISGVQAITGDPCEFYWIFAESNPPFDIVIATPTLKRLEAGARKWNIARDEWKKCLESQIWSSYKRRIEIDADLWELRDLEVSVYPEAEVIGGETELSAEWEL